MDDHDASAQHGRGGQADPRHRLTASRAAEAPPDAGEYLSTVFPRPAHARKALPIALVHRLSQGLLLALTTLGAAGPAATQPGGPGGGANRVLELDGEGAHVELPVAAFRDLRQATIEGWVRHDDWASYSQWFAYGVPDDWRALGMNHFSITPTLQLFAYPTGRIQDLHLVAVQTALPAGRWHHMAAAMGPGGARFYVDGVLFGRADYDGAFAALEGDAVAFLGLSTWGANAPFRGAMDEVRLWAEARSIEQIRAGMERAADGTERGLRALWNFDDGDARDAGPGGHHGRLRQGARSVPGAFPGATVPVRPAVLRGTVRDARDRPVQAARIRLRPAVGPPIDGSSGVDGTFAVALFEPGEYVLETISNAEAIPPRRFTVAPGDQRHLDLQPRRPNLVARWSGEGDARDDVGGLHGILEGDVGFTPGVVGQAFHFRSEGLVRVPNAPELFPEESFSVSLWARADDDRVGTLVSVWSDQAPWFAQRAYRLLLDPGRRLVFSLSDTYHQDDTAFHIFQTRPNAMPLRTWCHIVAVWDAPAGERRIYVNGVLMARRVFSSHSIHRSMADLSIGASLLREDVPAHHFSGGLDEISFYGTDLTEEAISRVYGAHARARWTGDGNATDATRSGHDGIAVGPVGYAPGIAGDAFVFSGDGYVEVDPRIGNYGVADFSAELWVRPVAVDGQAPLLAKGDAEDAAIELALAEDGRVTAALVGRDASLRLTTAAALSVDSWHHLALVREGRRLDLHVDGRLDTSATSRAPIDVRSAGPLLIGGGPRAGGMVGQIDEVALHRRPLSAAEVSETHGRLLSAWRRDLWTTRLQTWGGVAAALLALAIGSRYASHRLARRRQWQQLMEARQARQAADEASAAKSAFLAHLSHEIRTPLNVILGHAQSLRDRPTMSTEDRRSLDAIHRHGGFLVQMLTDVLDLSKMEAGRQSLQVSDFDLGQLIDSLADLFEPRCRQKGLRFHVYRDGELGIVRGDEGKLRQVLVNLLSNAAKFSDVGEVALGIFRAGANCTFEVKDSGPGIDPQTRQLLFEPFHQGPLGLAAGGTGLGLAIARRHVELMGGELEVASVPGEGSTFSFRIVLEVIGAGQAPADPGGEPDPGLAPYEGLALPAPLRGRLREAAHMQNLTEVKQCLDRLAELGEREARLAAELRDAVRRFDLRPVVRILETTVDA